MNVPALSRFRYFVDREQYLGWLCSDACQNFRRAIEKPVATLLKEGGTRNFFCHAHGGIAQIVHAPQAATDTGYNWRESAACSECGAIARIRLAAEWLNRAATNYQQKRIYLTEQLTPLYRVMRKRHPTLVGSEFVPDRAQRYAATARLAYYMRDATEVVRHEDACELTFADQSFDLVGSFDVLEHIPDYVQALREFHRVLTPGGQLLLTAPFLNASAETLVRASIKDGELRHLEPPEYHGNPTVSDGGVLCFYHFGWDLLQLLREIGFRSVALLDAWSDETALYGDQMAIVATR